MSRNLTKQIFEIHPTVGFGPISFGDHPKKIREVFGETLTWEEEWMDGNMNDCLYYRGVYFRFDAADSSAPLPQSRLWEIVLWKYPNAVLWDKLMVEWTKQRFLAALRIKRLDYRELRQNVIEVTALGMEMGFGEDNHCQELMIESGQF